MSTAFGDPGAHCMVFVNDEGQHSLWPVFAQAAVGWRTAHGPAARQECPDRMTENWTEMRECNLAADATTWRLCLAPNS
ncbi:MbtH family protein [Streptomyces noursei]|uniref:MbtH-like domain-containing protein n=1 Tax=Streptomyces noursei TaxID=1971 RepID=A0A2N8PHX6_STRNR|nr:MbtH family NRPS accessory protein [Streptomyces noursei]PNE40632.1 hypothetical protein AOB60_07190 [Streptomyces noursei]